MPQYCTINGRNIAPLQYLCHLCTLAGQQHDDDQPRHWLLIKLRLARCPGKQSTLLLPSPTPGWGPTQFMFAKLRRNPPPRMGRKPKGAAAAAAAAAAPSDGDADLDADQEFFEDGTSAADEAEDAAECAAGGGGKAANGRGKKGAACGRAEGRAEKEELRPWLYLMPGLIRLGYQVGRVWRSQSWLVVRLASSHRPTCASPASFPAGRPACAGK